MQTVDIDYLDREFTVSEEEPTTLAEMVPILGTEEAVVEEAADNLRYRNKYPRVYDKVSEALTKDHSWPKLVIKSETKADGSVKQTFESDMNHIRAALKGRLADEKTGAAAVEPLADAKTVLQTLFTSFGTSEPLYIKGEKTGGGGKVSEAALKASNGFFAEGDEKVKAVATYIEATVPGYKVARDASGAPTVDSLARAIGALQRKAVKDAEANSLAGLGQAAA